MHGVGMAEEQLDIGHGEPEVGGQENASDVPGGSVEAVEGRAPAAGEAFLAGLALELLNVVAETVADEGMEGGIGVAPIVTKWLGAGMASGADVLRSTH
jgi:hypothetical protein